MSILLEFCSAFILVFFEISSWYNIIKKKIELHDYKIYILTIILALFQIINYHFSSGFIKSIGILITFIIACKLIFNKSLKNCFIISFLCEFTVIFAETLIVMIAYSLFGLDMSSIGNIRVTFVIDILVGIFVFLITKLNIYNKIYNYLKIVTINFKSSTIFWAFIFVMIGASAIFTSIYLKENIVLVLVINILIILIYTVIVFLAFQFQYRYYKESAKYSNSLEVLKTQENIINDYRISNHENRNQLNTLRSMTKNKKINEYIDSILKQKNSYNYNIIKKISKIPKGGMRALIYNKLIYMNEKNINNYIHIDNKVSSESLLNINTDDMVDICQILGVFIDNAIEETILLNQNSCINMQMYIENNNLIFSISNKYNNLEDKKVLKTSKGIGRGYGLKLVKRIINKNNNIDNQREILKDTFTQKIFVKLDK